MSTLPRLLGDGLLGSLIGGGSTSGSSTQNSGVSRGFEIFCKNVNRKMGPYDRDQTIRREIVTLKDNLSQPNVSMPVMRDYLCRVVYCNMMGYDVTWAFIHAVKLAQQGSNLEKRMGYLACSLLLYRDHELILLLINTIQKDLKSSNILDNMVAMTAAGHLVPSENIPMLLPLVLEKLRHSRELVRQRAVVTLHQLQLLAPDILEHCQDVLRKALFDKDPGVMAATVNLVYDQVKQDPNKHESLTAGLMSVLRQVVGRKMASMFEYHSVPAPWLQIKLIRTLTLLCRDSQQNKTGLLPLLEEIIQKTGVRENISFAILYECLQCILALRPGRQSVELVASQVKCFLNSSEPNLKFVGMKVLMSLVETEERYVTHYQSLIMESLNNPDLNVQKKMHRLLFKIANKSNGDAVCSQLLQQLSSSSDRYWKSDIVTMVLQLVQRFSDPQQWQIQHLFTCLQMGEDLINSTVTRDIISYLNKEIVSSIEDCQSQRELLLHRCVTALEPDTVTSTVLKISAWVVSELSPLLKSDTGERVVSLFTHHFKNSSLPVCTMISLLSALQKLVVKQNVDYVTMATSLREVLRWKLSVAVKQRLTLLLCVCEKNFKLAYPTDVASIDTTLSFLDDHVSRCLESGLPAYIPVHLRRHQTEAPSEQEVSLYAAEREGDAGSSSVGRLRTESNTSSNRTSEDLREPESRLPSVKKVWSRQGRLEPDSHTNSAEDTQLAKTSIPDHHQQLAQALFSGIPPLTEESETESAEMFDILDDDDDKANVVCNTGSTSGWRSLHSTPVSSAPMLVSSSNTESTSLPLDKNQFLPNDSLKNSASSSSFDLSSNFTSSSPVAMTTRGQHDPTDSLTGDSTFTLPKGDNSSFLNISVSSNDESRVSVTHVNSRADSRLSGLDMTSGGNQHGTSLYDSASPEDWAGHQNVNHSQERHDDTDSCIHNSEHKSLYGQEDVQQAKVTSINLGQSIYTETLYDDDAGGVGTGCDRDSPHQGCAIVSESADDSSILLTDDIVPTSTKTLVKE